MGPGDVMIYLLFTLPLWEAIQHPFMALLVVLGAIMIGCAAADKKSPR